MTAAARGRPAGSPRAALGPLAAAALLCAGYAVLAWTQRAAARSGLLADDLGVAAAAALAALSCAWKARTARGRFRAGWSLLTGSQGLLALGVAVHGISGDPGPAEPASCPGGAMLAAALPLALVAVVLLADRPHTPMLWLCRCLDAAITTGSLLALVWSLALIRAGSGPGTLLDQSAAAHVYPVLDILAVGVVLGMRLRAHGRNGAMLVNIVLAGLSALSVCDALVSPPGGTVAVLHSGEAVHVGWFAGCLALACIPWIERWSARAPRGRPGFGLPVLSRIAIRFAGPGGRPGTVCSALTPYVAAAICVAAVAWPMAEHRGVDPVTLLCCSAVLITLLVRQGVTLLQNAALTRELARNSRELAEKESHFRSLVQGSSDVIMIAGPDGLIRYVSPAALHVYGRRAESLVGLRLRELVHPEDRGRVVVAARRHLDGEGPDALRLEYRVRAGAGGWAHVESVVSRHGDGLIFNSRDVTERVRLQAQLQHNAFHDPLTDLPNRTLFAERTRQALGGRRAADRAVSVLYIDLDGFKAVNDASGHEIGDELLVQVARRLEGSVRSDDTVARLGGDEFAALICGDPDDLAQHEMVEIAERLLDQLSRPYSVAGHEVAVAASIGIAFAEARTSPAELLRNADLAMYRAKAKGKGRVEVYAPQMRADVLRRSVLDRRLRAAMRDGGFALLHQPVVDLRTAGAPAAAPVVALEAHIRWRSARGALLTPAEMLRTANGGNRAAELAGWAAARAIEEASRRGVEDGTTLPVTVRLPATVLQRADFAERVGTALDATGLPPGRLLLELTGSGAAHDMLAITAAVEALHRAGVRIGLGGTPAPGLEALYRWPLTQLRLDAGLVRRLADPGAASGREAARLPRLTSAVLRLAHELGLTVVADAVTRAEQADALRGFGCDCAQGALFGGPLAEADLRARLAPQRARGAGPVPAPRRPGALAPPPGQ